MKYIVYIFLAILQISYTFSQDTINFKSTKDILSIGKNIKCLEDSRQGLTIKDILKPKIQGKFRPNNNILFHKTSTASVFWIKFTVNNQTDKDIWLAIENTFILYLDLYAVDTQGNIEKVAKTGSLRSYDSREYPVINGFWLPLKKVPKARTYYLSITSHFAIDADLKIGTSSKLHQERIVHNNLSVAFIGLMLIMILYNTFLACMTKEKLYVLYTAHLIFSIPIITFLNSYPILEYLTDYQIQSFWHHYFSIWGYPGLIFSVLFCVHFLDLKSNLPRSIYFLKGIILLQFITIFLNITNIVSVHVITVIEQIISLLLYFICIFSASYLFFIKKLEKARYYLLGWSFFFLGITLLILSGNGFIPHNIYLRNATYFGVALEVWMFSIALGKRINVLKEEKEASLRQVQKQKDELEAKVKERTQEIEKQKDELKSNNEKLRANEEVLLKSHYQLKNTLSKNKEYLEQIEGQKMELNKSNKQMKAIQKILMKSNKRLKTTLEENELYAQQIEEQKKQLEDNNEKMEVNQAVLMKSHKKLKEALRQNKTYLAQIEKQKEILDKRNQEIQSNHQILIKSNQRLKRALVQIEEQKEELYNQNQEILTQNEEISGQNEEFMIINEKLKVSESKQKELNETKDKLFSIVAHDLKAPLDSIHSFLDLFLHYDILGEKESRIIAKDLYQTVKNTSLLLTNLLHWARSQMGEISINLVVINLNDIIENNIQLFKNIAETKKINLLSNVKKDTIVLADNDMLDFTIRNLLSNAIKFTPQKGQIQINVKLKSNDFVKIEIQDSGIGIPKKNLKKLFSDTEHISTIGTENEKGTGLGLKLSKEFVERNGGKIWVESEVNKGTSFYFTVPLTKDNTEN